MKEIPQTTTPNYSQSIPETKRIRSTSVLPFKKRRTMHQFDFLSTAISKDQTPTLSFTFEEEFRLHNLIVRRDYVMEEQFKYMLIKGPMIIKSSMEKLAQDISKN